MFTNIYSKYVLFYLGVIGLHLVNSGPDMLLLLLKAPTNNSAPSSPTRLTSWALSSSIDLSLTISCRSTGLNPALSKRSRVAPNLTLSLSEFSARSDSIFNALGAISAKLRLALAKILLYPTKVYPQAFYLFNNLVSDRNTLNLRSPNVKNKKG